MENRRLDGDLAQGDNARQRAASPTFIDLLPIELLERVIHLGATDFRSEGPMLKWVCVWQRVSRKWASVIDGYPALWSYIDIGHGIENLEDRLAKSKALPLDIQFSSPPGSEHDKGWIRLLADNKHRWRSLAFGPSRYFREMLAILDSSPPVLETLHINSVGIEPDCQLFNPVSTHLRKLSLSEVVLPKNFDPPSGLDELRLSEIWERTQDTITRPIRIANLRRFLQASPELRSLTLDGWCTNFEGSNEVPPVDLPKLQNAQIFCPSSTCSVPLHLFRAGHCAQLGLDLKAVGERPPLMAWANLVDALKRAEELKIVVKDTSLSIRSKPYTVGLTLRIKADHGDPKDLIYSILEDILNEAEQNSSLSARIELILLTTLQWEGDFNVALEVLNLLQTPISDPSSRLTRRRLPHLRKLHVPKCLPNQRLQGFRQARSNRGGSS